MNTKVRFVRCPRCRHVLPELAELPLYKCGGCGTVLQAKNRKNDTKEAAEPCNLETLPTGRNELELVSEDNNKDISLNQLPILPSTEEFPSVKSSEGDQNEIIDCRREQLVGVRNSDEIPISIELSCHENADSSPEAHAHMESDDDHKTDQNDFEGSTDSDEVLNRLEIESSSPLAAALKEEDKIKYPLEQNNRNGENEFGDYGSERPKEAYSSSSELTCNEIEELAEDSKTRFIFRSSSPENSLDSSASARRSVAESVLSKDLTSPSLEQTKEAQNGIILPSFERFSSVDTLENVPLVYSSSELGVARREMYKSPTARSYYAYDGSESSCNEIHNKIPNRHLHLSRRNFKDEHVSSSTGKNQQVKNTMRLDTNEQLSRATFYSRCSQAGPSSYEHNESLQQGLLRHRSPNKPDYRESDKVELLRMVYELQNQLKRTHISKLKSLSSYHDHLAPEREIYDGRYGNGRGKFCSPQCKFQQMAVHRRHQVGCSCLQCGPREWRCSAQLPPRGICCSGPYQSGPSGSPPPQQHRGGNSEFSMWGRDTKMSDDQTRDKHQRAKRHLRPIAGGSPIIACYRCFELLKVPADFLPFRRRCHRLRCNACSEVLKFSLQNRIHIVRYIPEDIAPPPSEVDQSFCKSGSTDRKISSSSSFEPMEEKKKMKKSVIETSENKNKNPVEAYDCVGPSMKRSKWEESSSEIEEITPGRSSQLHRLMGYSSPSIIMNG